MTSNQNAAPAATPDICDELERLARQATPGTWWKRSARGMPSFVSAPRANKSDPYDIEVLGEDDTIYPTREADVDYIAAAHPAVVLTLIERLRQAEARYELLMAEFRGPGEPRMTVASLNPVFAVGDNIVLPQDFNATCGTIQSITPHADGSAWALCTNAHDIFGKCPRDVNIPLAFAKPWPQAPRMLSLGEAVSV